MLGLVESLINVGSKFIEDKDKKNEFAVRTMEMMLESKTYRWVDGIVKLSYAAEQITKGLLRPVFSIGVFCYALINPEILEQLHALGTVGDAGVAAILGSAPAWGYSRHTEKKRSKEGINDYEG